MGNNTSTEPPKVCLVPPLIRRRHARPICANEFLYFGRPTHELLNDFLSAGSFVRTDMVLKPQIRLVNGRSATPTTPDVTAFLEGTIHPEPLAGHIEVGQLGKNAGMMLALESRWKNQMRAVLRMRGSESKAPEVYIGVGREDLKGTSFFVSVDPRPESVQGDFGLTQSFQYGTVGFSASILGREQLPMLAAWTALKPVPAISLGSNFKLAPSPTGGYIPDYDLAINIRDVDALIYDRPAYDITFKSLSKGKTFGLSYFQHFVIRRKIYNPIEEKHITHITNYIDVGAEINVEQEKMEFGVGGSWQINKNNLFKARLSQDIVQATAIFKTWANPSFIFYLNGGYNFRSRTQQIGVGLTCEASLGQAEFERAGVNYEEVQVVRYGAEAAPEVHRWDMINDESPVSKHVPVAPLRVPQTVVVPPTSL